MFVAQTFQVVLGDERAPVSGQLPRVVLMVNVRRRLAAAGPPAGGVMRQFVATRTVRPAPTATSVKTVILGTRCILALEVIVSGVCRTEATSRRDANAAD